MLVFPLFLSIIHYFPFIHFLIAFVPISFLQFRVASQIGRPGLPSCLCSILPFILLLLHYYGPAWLWAGDGIYRLSIELCASPQIEGKLLTDSREGAHTFKVVALCWHQLHNSVLSEAYRLSSVHRIVRIMSKFMFMVSILPKNYVFRTCFRSWWAPLRIADGNVDASSRTRYWKTWVESCTMTGDI